MSESVTILGNSNFVIKIGVWFLLLFFFFFLGGGGRFSKYSLYLTVS